MLALEDSFQINALLSDWEMGDVFCLYHDLQKVEHICCFMGDSLWFWDFYFVIEVV